MELSLKYIGGNISATNLLIILSGAASTNPNHSLRSRYSNLGKEQAHHHPRRDVVLIHPTNLWRSIEALLTATGRYCFESTVIRSLACQMASMLLFDIEYPKSARDYFLFCQFVILKLQPDTTF